jgi:hypothetical protein
MALYGAGAFEEAEAQLADGVALADSQGAAFWSLVGRLWLCVLASERGHPEEGPVGLGPLMTQADAVGIGISRPFLASVRATDVLGEGRSDEALALARAACREAGRTGQRLWAPEIWRRCAEVHFARGEIREGRSCGRIALAFAEANATEPMAVRCRGTLVLLRYKSE